MVSIGPFAATLVAIPVALIVATIAGTRLARRDQAVRSEVFPMLVDTLGVGLLAARIGFIIQWWPQYAQDPWAMIRLGDGGYLVWLGLLAAGVFAAWRLHRRPPVRRAYGGALAAGAAGWGASLGVLALLAGTPLMLPEVELRTPAGAPQALTGFVGQPTVVNLWATWCPPCRREMPVLADAQQQHGDIHFVFANQGEHQSEVDAYLASGFRHLDNVLLDPHSDVSRAVGSRGLPTTLFFDAEGRLVDSHVGELTRASLAARLRGLDQRR